MSRAKATPQRVLDEALAMFRAHGYDRTTLRDIATKVGITAAAIHYHFPAKDDLLTSLVTPLLDGLDALVAGGAGTGPHDLLGQYLDELLRHADLIEFVVNDRAVLTHPAVGERAQHQNERLRSLLAGEEAESERLVRAAAALGAVQAVVLAFPAATVAEHRDVVLGAAMAALGSPLAPRR